MGWFKPADKLFAPFAFANEQAHKIYYKIFTIHLPDDDNR